MIICADARRIPLADESVQCCVTSPPYWGLRKYAGEQELVWSGREDCRHEWLSERTRRESGGWQGGSLRGITGGLPKGQDQFPYDDRASYSNLCSACGAWRGAYGLEPTVEMYVAHAVEIFREVRRVLRYDGCCFLNIGDSYASRNMQALPQTESGIKVKDLCLIPQRLAIALQADGWWVRSDIIWSKPNPMPESCKDRPTDAYEHVLMLTKSGRYYWDGAAVAEPVEWPENKARVQFSSRRARAAGKIPSGNEAGKSYLRPEKRNLRNVWTFATQPYKGAHFATFPEELPRRCILAASKPGDLVLDPFAGSGTTGRVAIALGRVPVMLDLAYGAEYRELAERRTSEVQIEAFA